ncbi:MAG: hypothetical protein KDJ78_11720 [Rhodobacteraceae bacterium]|uniref:hypothetical protein n=1 Tax=Amaricoccus sp. TaxID=1872485 RepID=UPI001D771415|nr:hypothetical protein [Amaricoccus sp.]MCB1374819.1 hypothetical protein [Paracoccaceae bacterium]MCB1403241.1 hypothetical protein [Paracoccaceae bacterium]MCC0068131.1 hypothetical protein [Rhodovulum sp.]HRW15606.1 hypothetical protein [Amaricoccus sp.]
MMRIPALVVVGALAACTSSVTVPSDTVLYEVPPAGTVSTAGGGGDNFTATIESSLAEGSTGATAPLPQAGTPLDDDRLNLMEYTLEQQKIDAAIAERDLQAARSKLVVVPTTSVPSEVQGVNIALYAQQTTNAVGERRYDRRVGARLSSSCGRYRTPDEAQRAFLAAGGPQTDSLGLDPDGDGFACKWDPTPYRQLKI